MSRTMIEAKTLKEAIETKSLPQYNRKLTKKTLMLLESIAKNLPKEVYTKRLAKVNGSDLLNDDAKTIGSEEIDPNQSYTVFESVKTKTNHHKRLRKAWLMSNSPFNVILYGFRFIGNKHKNEWIELINLTFKTKYPKAYLEDSDSEKDWDE